MAGREYFTGIVGKDLGSGGALSYRPQSQVYTIVSISEAHIHIRSYNCAIIIHSSKENV